MEVPQWLPVLTESINSSRRSSVSEAGTARSDTSARTAGSLAYVPPQLRSTRNTLRTELDIARNRNELATEARASAKHTGPKMPVFELPYCLDKQQLAFLVARFPRTTFRCVQDTAHDHPIAHSETMIALRNMKRMVPAGHTMVDLFGSPAGCDQLNRSQEGKQNPKRAVAYCAIKTEKDYLRSLKWGDVTAPDGRARYMDGVDLLADLAPTSEGIEPYFGVPSPDRLSYILNHTLYYLSDLEIASLLKPVGSRMYAIVHRHPGTQGTLFDGECTYGKLGENMVEQVNVLTGERYTHRDLSWLWSSTTKVVRTDAGAFVWTFHMVSPDTWIVELTGCNGRLDERMVSRTKALGEREAAAEMNEHALQPTPFPHPAMLGLPAAKCVMVSGVPLIKFTGSMLPNVRFSCPALFDFLRVTQVGKPRSPERLHDLFSLARSHVANGSEFPGKRNFVLPPEDIAGHVVMAYIAGLTSEVDLLRAIEGYRVFSREHQALLDGSAIIVNTDGPQTAVRSVVSVLKRVNDARKNGDAVAAVLQAIE